MTDRWLVLEVRSPSAEHVAGLTEGLMALGSNAVVETEDWLSTWLPAPHDAEATIASAREWLCAIAGAGVEIRWSFRGEQDWTLRWRRGLGARRVGQRFVVTPTWVQPEMHDGDIVLTIDPQMAFGTGEHASTRGALRLIEVMLEPGARVLDVGTGSAILAIAAARLGAKLVDAVDCDPDALVNARENVDRHGCQACIHLHEAFVDLDYLFGSSVAAGPYDLIVGNVLSGMLVPLLPGFRTALRPSGSLILAGVLAYEADAVIEAATGSRFRLVREDRDEEWWAGGFTVTHP
jgi:ribosomal protein L11 methyltransferase